MTAKKTTKPAKKAAKTSPKKIATKKTTPKPVKKLEKKASPSSSKKVVKKTKPVISKKTTVAKKLSKPAKAVKKEKVTPKKEIKNKAVKTKPTAPKKAAKENKAVKKNLAPKEKKTKTRQEMVVKNILRPEETRTIASTRVEKPTHGALYVRSGRHFFTEDRAIVDMPELIAAQLNSYESFLEHGLREALESVFPIADFSEERVEIHFKGMELEEPRYTAKECRRKNLNYESYLRVKLQMLNKETGEIKEDTVFMGGIPLMTNKGTFIVNGVERVVVHQIIKADGISFEADA